jgi:hypothetical protein
LTILLLYNGRAENEDRDYKAIINVFPLTIANVRKFKW